MSSRELPSTTEDILRRCPRFRILLVGKSGVGKSSLINASFNVNIATVSHQAHGICDINTEITSPQNPRFVLHDSQGFEPGEVGNLDKVKNFIQARGEGVDLEERVHAVWLCVQIPFAGGRVFEKGDEDFLKSGQKVPVIVVFTKFDKLVSRQEQYMSKDEKKMKPEQIESISGGRADEAFQKSCVDQLHNVGPHLSYAKVSIKPKHRGTLTNLINITQELVSRHIEGDVWIVSAMAQRASAQAKIDSSIEVGMKQYWQSLASSTRFSGSTLEKCLAIIHTDITSNWNFSDPENLLDAQAFREQIMALVQMVTPDTSDMNSWFSQSLTNTQNIIGVTSTLVSAIAPVAAAIGLSAMFIQWITKLYQATPEVLRCLMAYIIDLTLVLDQLFLDTLHLKPPRLLNAEQIDMALEHYKTSEVQQVHCKIREYVKQSTFGQIVKSGNAQQKVIELIRQHRVDTAAPGP